MSILSRLGSALIGRGPEVRALPAPVEMVACDAVVERAAKPTPRPGPIIGPLSLSSQIQRIGGSITPLRLSQVIREADIGYTWELIDLENEARQKDCHLQSILATRELAVSGLSFEVVAPDNSLARDRKAAQWVQERLQALDDFPALLGHMQGACYHGYSVTETMWMRDGGDVVPRCFVNHSPRRFCFDQATQSLNWWDSSGGGDSGPYPGKPMSSFVPGTFIAHQPRINGDVPCREGLGRVLMWAALFRNWTIRDWLSLAELAWKPWRTGTYEPSAGQEDIDNLVEILLQMSASGVAVHKSTCKLDIHWPDAKGSSSSNHGELASFLGDEMSKATLGQTLTTQAGERGARSLGQVHDGVRKDIRESDARAVAATLRRDLIAPMIRANFSAGVKVPILRFLTQDAPDLESLGKFFPAMAKVLRIPAAHVYDLTGIPEPKADEEILAGYDVDTSELEDEEPAPPPDEDAEEPAEAA